MMKIFKVKFFLLILILFSLISVSAVSAGEDDLKNSSQGNFTELNQEFSNSVDSVNLTKDFVHGDEEDDLKISKSINIDGNNHSIDFKNNSSLNINNTLNLTVVFKNIHFNGKFNITLNNENSINLSFIDCCFLGNADELNNSFVSSYYDLNVTKCFTGIITKDIEDLAWNIVGKSQGIDAAKKLAKWVGKKIRAESKAGFYQTPSQTAARKLGNCCSQTDLFLQMCYVVGVTKTCKVSYVHVGIMAFGHRHFFALIDNLVVDPGDHSNSPWGHATISSSVFAVTEYPMIPLEREY